MKIFFDLNPESLNGRRERNKGVLWHINELGKFLEQCYVEWLDHVDKQRKKYYHLNHYTTHQLVILRKEIANLCGSPRRPANSVVYPMLHYVRQNCNDRNLIEAIANSESEVKEMLARTKDDDLKLETNDDLQDGELSVAEKEFIKKVNKSGHTEQLALMALKEGNIKPSDIRGGLSNITVLLGLYLDCRSAVVREKPRTGHSSTKRKRKERKQPGG